MPSRLLALLGPIIGGKVSRVLSHDRAEFKRAIEV